MSVGAIKPCGFPRLSRRGLCLIGLLVAFCPCPSGAVAQVHGQQQQLRFGMQVPPDVDRITSRALDYLASSQLPDGNWAQGFDTHAAGRENPGVTGLALMAMMSRGNDPNVGVYAKNIRAAIRYIIVTQNPETGFLPNTMYNHGFAMLALAEAYGVIDESLLWSDAESDSESDDTPDRRRSLGLALRLAVECALKSQNQNSLQAWRYRPNSKDADTSVTGAVLIGLLAARNAGVPVPDENFKKAFQYIHQQTRHRSGIVHYTDATGAFPGQCSMSAISSLVLAIGQQSETDDYQAASKRLTEFIDRVDASFPYYNMYYMAQALFQFDYESWNRWNQLTIRRLRRQQTDDGSFDSEHGKAYATSMASLSLALNYRFLPIYER